MNEQLHIATIDFVQFYTPAFGGNEENTRKFLDSLESLPADRRLPKVVLHQAARMIWLADRMDEIAKGRPALQVLFLLIAAEAVAKMVFGYANEGQSKRYVHRFFGEICTDHHRSKLDKSFAYTSIGPFLTSVEAIDLLYRVRCEVAHEAMYYQFHLRDEADSTPHLTSVGATTLITLMSVEDLRQIVLEGAVEASRIALARLRG